jgi:dTDP-4-dehydrorhamnose reductase
LNSVNKNILVTGANGQLGSEIKYLSKFHNINFTFTDIEELDITSMDEIEGFFSSQEFGYIINCAAYTAVDKAEEEKEEADLANHIAVKNLAVMSSKFNAKLIHISTDFVFDGSSSIPFTEEDKTNPVSVYGKTKLAGEKAVLKHGSEVIIIRTSWLYSSFGNNFVKTMIGLTKKRNSIGIVFDQLGTPTYARDLAEAVLNIINSQDFLTGVYHYSNEGVASWYDFTKAIVEIAGIKCSIDPIETYQYPTPAKRPAYSILNKAKIKKAYNMEIPYWKTSLEKCINILKQKNT